MATYVISDIHGQLRAFKAILNKVNFNLKEDTLHILGDNVDWGSKSVETLQFIKELKEKAPNKIETYMGNHELMMLNSNKYYEATENSFLGYLDGIWYRNGGDKTADKLDKLPKEDRVRLLNFVRTFKYYNENVEVNGKKFYLAHAAPFMGRPTDSEYTKRRMLDDVVWDRVEQWVNPLELIYDKRKFRDHIFIFGHTITSNYDSFDSRGNNKVYKDLANRKIGIDCGAKVMDYQKKEQYRDKYKGYRLAILRLDDLKEFYQK